MTEDQPILDEEAADIVAATVAVAREWSRRNGLSGENVRIGG